MGTDDAQPFSGLAAGTHEEPTPASAARRGSARALRHNALGIFPPEAFREEVVYRRLFARRQIIVSRPDAIHHILVANPANYARTAATIRVLRPLLGDGLLLSEGEAWREQRRALAPAFAPRAMPALVPPIAATAEIAVNRLAAAGGRPVDLLAAMQSLTLEIAGRALFSLEMTRFEPELRGLVNRYAERLGKPGFLDFMLPLWLPTPRDIARRRFRRHWRQLLARIVAARRAKAGEVPPDLFDLLMPATPRDGQPPLRRGAALLDRMATILVAGHETTAVALFWALLLLADFPAVQQRVAEEAAGRDLGPEGATEALPALVYARAVVQEAMRLYPPAFTLARLARSDDEAGGIAVPAGAVVLIAPWVLHRHERFWSEPERFDPARFMPGAPPLDRFAYMPFGLGPRACIGTHFALNEATLVLARMVQAFHIERADNAPVNPVAIVTTQPDRRPPFRLHRRDSGTGGGLR